MIGNQSTCHSRIIPSHLWACDMYDDEKYVNGTYGTVEHLNLEFCLQFSCIAITDVMDSSSTPEKDKS